MSKTFTAANYFDLIDFIRNIVDVEIAAQAAQSLAFRVDLLIQSNARAIFRTLREEELNKLAPELQTADNRADLENAFRSVEFAEQTFADYTDRISGNISTLKSLSFMRDGINDMARELTGMTADWRGIPRRYEAANLDELFLARPDLKMSTTEQLRSRQMIEALKQTGLVDPNADTEELLRMDAERRKDELNRMADTMHKQGPITLMFYELALQADGEVVQNFYDLDKAVQRVCVESVIGAVQRTLDRAKSDRSLSSMDFVARIGNGMQVLKQLNEVLRAPRMTTAV